MACYGIDISKIHFGLESFIGKSSLILLSVSDGYEFINGKKSTNRTHTKYEVIQNGGDYQRFIVKVPETEPVTYNDELRASKEPVLVDFQNAQCKFYQDSNHNIQVSVTADSITLL